MATLTFPLSRIEGHAQVSIDVENGQAVAARFEAMELRGFEYIVLGAHAEQMPVLVPRICGVCSTAHHVAAVKALEDIYGVAPPPLALRLRELLLLGQLIQNQATSLVLFSMPDRLQVDSLLLAGEAGNAAAQAAIAQRALQVRRAGTDLITLAGGQFIHPVKAVVGGVTSGIEPSAAEDMRRTLEAALPVACALFDTYWEMSLALRERIGTWGDDAPTHYLTSVGDSCPDYSANLLRIQDPAGALACTFPARDWRLHLTSHESEYSHAGHTSYQGQVLRANSLARINMARHMGTPRADGYLARFRAAFGRPAHGILLYDLCRGIELVYALERALDLLAQPLASGETEVPYQPRDGEGYGLVEAPRGPLIHQYRVERGLVADAHFIIPTVHNGLAIERALLVAARRYVTAERVDLELERAVGRVVRAFDPCIACATH